MRDALVTFGSSFSGRNCDSMTLHFFSGRAGGLIFHYELHVHVVVAASALYRTFNQVFPGLLRRHQRVFLRSFLKADVHP